MASLRPNMLCSGRATAQLRAPTPLLRVASPVALKHRPSVIANAAAFNPLQNPATPIARPQVHTRGEVKCSASSASTPAAEEPAPTASWKLPTYIFLWYAFNIVFNILNKSSLNAFPCPWFISTLQLAASGLFMCVLWATKLHPVPQVDKAFFLTMLPVGLFHTIGHVSACLSFNCMAVSFAHIVKSSEPLFSVVLSGPLLGVNYPGYVWLSLVPIVAGCALSAMKEVSFAWAGFNYAMVSNIGMVLRNIYSKKSLTKYKNIDGINLFGLISIVSLLYCAPLAVVLEGSQWSAAWQVAVEKLGQGPFLQLLAVAGVFYHLYNQLSYMVLNEGISPVTFSVGNTMKRVVVVISSVLFFRNPVSILNWVGSATAILGTYLYTLASDKFTAEQKAAKAAEASGGSA
eukprot:gene15629-21735_t